MILVKYIQLFPLEENLRFCFLKEKKWLFIKEQFSENSFGGIFKRKIMHSFYIKRTVACFHMSMFHDKKKKKVYWKSMHCTYWKSVVISAALTILYCNRGL